MPFVLSDQNVVDYLIQHQLWEVDHGPSTATQSFNPLSNPPSIQLKNGKNFNLCVQSATGRALLVKQERYDSDGETAGEFWNEWYFYQAIQQFSELADLHPLIIEPRRFDAEASILVFDYLSNHVDLINFYDETTTFPIEIAAAMGTSLAKLHQLTYKHAALHQFFAHHRPDIQAQTAPTLLSELTRLRPEVLSVLAPDGLMFLRLLQRYDTLQQAIAQARQRWQPCCLIHRDARLNNWLVHPQWQTQPHALAPLRLIDWEKFTWGDPAFDVATVLAGYLKLWLSSLAIHPSLDIATTLQLARIPLETIQPSLVTLLQTYLRQFPQILDSHPDFCQRVLPLIGIVLIETLQVKVEHHAPFDNGGICILQVAKTLLCQPEAAIAALFGTTLANLHA
jgi:hypothetical protein